METDRNEKFEKAGLWACHRKDSPWKSNRDDYAYARRAQTHVYCPCGSQVL